MFSGFGSSVTAEMQEKMPIYKGEIVRWLTLLGVRLTCAIFPILRVQAEPKTPESLVNYGDTYAAQ